MVLTYLSHNIVSFVLEIPIYLKKIVNSHSKIAIPSRLYTEKMYSIQCNIKLAICDFNVADKPTVMGSI